jgi:tRNA(adenine34) deaminase
MRRLVCTTEFTVSIEKPTEADCRLMDRALQEARGAFGEGKAGRAALLASADNILEVGYNTVNITHNMTDHAEMVLLRLQPTISGKWTARQRKELSVYVTLERV